MKHRALFAILLAALCAATAACSSLPEPGSPLLIPDAAADKLPGLGGGITDTGSPVPTDESLPFDDEDPCVYRNIDHEFWTYCPLTWEIASSDETGAAFTSARGVALTISIVDLTADETFQSFLQEVRGGVDGLEEASVKGFEEALCVPAQVVDEQAGLFTVECYLAHTRQGTLRFVIVESGISDQELHFYFAGSLLSNTTDAPIVPPGARIPSVRRAVFP